MASFPVILLKWSSGSFQYVRVEMYCLFYEINIDFYVGLTLLCMCCVVFFSFDPKLSIYISVRSDCGHRANDLR